MRLSPNSASDLETIAVKDLTGTPQTIRAVFSDNSFTLLPGRPRILSSRTEGEYPVSELETKLVIRHLRGSYLE